MIPEKNRLVARKGYILTDGISYGYVVVLGDGANPNYWYGIPIEEYQRLERERIQRAIAEAEDDD